MKRRWTIDELAVEWTLLPSEIELANTMRSDKNRLGFALDIIFYKKA